MIKESITKLLQNALKELNLDTNYTSLNNSPNENFGDYSTPIALSLSKKINKNPLSVAEEIKDKIIKDYRIQKIEVVKPGFINFFLTTDFLINKAREKINLKFSEGEYYKKNIIVEYSSPNIAKPFTVGHLRSTIIGDAIANLLEITGSTVFRDNHIGDWGTQFGKQIYAILNYGNEGDIEKSSEPVKELVNLYVKFHEEAVKNKALEDEAREWFKKLENGDYEARRLWQKCIDWSFIEFEKIYKKLGVKFTENGGKGYGESFFEDKMSAVIRELREKKLTKISQGAEMIFFESEKIPPLMILKQNGTTLYATRDLAADKFRLESPRYTKDVIIINEVGQEQTLYFKQLFETEKMLGWISENQRIHIGHGLYRFKDSKMSTRKGNTIWLNDVLKEAENKASLINTKWEKGSEELNKISHAVGIGALKWNDLKRSPHLDIVFDWDEILSMNGNSGPYIQYTFARCQSVLSKSKVEINKLQDISINSNKFTNSQNKQEMTILKTMAKFEDIILESVNSLELSNLCNYLYDLAQKYNNLYQSSPIINEVDLDYKNLRLLITQKTASIIEIGLKILGIQTIEKM